MKNKAKEKAEGKAEAKAKVKEKEIIMSLLEYYPPFYTGIEFRCWSNPRRRKLLK